MNLQIEASKDEFYINDHKARQLINLAKKFFADPTNQKEYEVWHMKEYGYMPNESNPKECKEVSHEKQTL